MASLGEQFSRYGPGSADAHCLLVRVEQRAISPLGTNELQGAKVLSTVRSPPLDLVESQTLEHYAENAQSFWEGTRDHDVRQNRAALLDAIRATPPFRILDFGCGPGRDLAAFTELGHRTVGVDGCPEFVEMARAHSGCEVLLQSFFRLQLPAAAFDGVFANASLFHVPRAILPDVLLKLREALSPDGVLFCSNPRSFGDDREGWQGARYGCFLSTESWSQVISAAGFELEHSYLRPEGKPPEQQPWLAMVWRRTQP